MEDIWIIRSMQNKLAFFNYRKQCYNYCRPTDNGTEQYKNGEAHTSTPNRTTLRTPGISANAASTSGKTIENFVLGSTSLAPVKSISCTVLPRPLGYCSVTMTGIPKSRAPWSCQGNGKERDKNKWSKNDKSKEMPIIWNWIIYKLAIHSNLNMSSKLNGKQPTYQPLTYADDITEVFYGRTESLLHITTKKHSAWWCQVA